ncbi:MAG TPA: hypothetical protein VIH35_07010 [Kiritimatiellia bacterium]|jgi:hypothetical protein
MNGRTIALFLALGFAATCARAGSKDVNIAKDPGFEEAGVGDKILANWDYYSSKVNNMALVEGKARSGAKCLRLGCQGTKNAHLGVSQMFDVVPKGKYTFRAYVMNDKDDRLSDDVVGNIGVEWYDAEGNEISRVSSKEWDPKLSKMSWQEYEVETKAPQYASKVKFVIYLREGVKGGKGAILVDDAEIVVK